MPTRDFLERRNALWRRLRALAPSSPEFEETLAELSGQTGWDRARVLAGLGLIPDCVDSRESTERTCRAAQQSEEQARISEQDMLRPGGDS